MNIDSLYGGGYTNKIGLINIPHETYKLRQNEFDWLKSKLNNNGIIVSLMDNDRVGKVEAIWLRNHFNILPLLIPKQYNAKDFADLVKNNKFNIVADLIIKAVKQIEHYVRENMEYNGNTEERSSSPF
jgi:hypothetical protein